ncbi:hypothetical protein R1sor_025606 [Riccia sorocarpa]|uniref:Uncharacterized protein n=1 Tax=Riccia sorocarpa TaxID=122646 RepID=A0ABD3G926_9MARC
MVRDPGRAPSGLPPSQGGQPDRRERDRTHSTSASDLRTTPSTVGGRSPPHPRKSSGSGARTSGSMSSGGRTPGVTTGAASRGSTSQTSIPVTTSAPTPSIPAAPATVVRGSIGRGLRGGPSEEGPSGPTIPPIDVSDIFEAGSDTATLTRGQMQDLINVFLMLSFSSLLVRWGWGLLHLDLEVELRLSRRIPPDVVVLDHPMRMMQSLVVDVADDLLLTPIETDIATRLAAKYGPISVRHKNAKARVESRREKNIMVTNPYGHQGFGGFRARFKKKFGVYPEPKHNAFLRLHGMKRVFEFMRTGREFPEVGGPSNAEDDEQDDGADDAAAGSDVGANDDGAESSELEGSGNEFEEDDQGQAPQQERVEELEDAEDDEEDEDSSRFEIREALRAPVEPALTEAQRILRSVTGGESSAPRTLPQPAVMQAIPLDPPSGVLRALPRDPQPSVARTITPRTVTPQPSAARAVVSDPSRAQTTVPEPSSRQTRAQSHPASARGTEEQRGKKSKKSKK